MYRRFRSSHRRVKMSRRARRRARRRANRLSPSPMRANRRSPSPIRANRRSPSPMRANRRSPSIHRRRSPPAVYRLSASPPIQRRSPPAVHRRRSYPAVHRLSASPPIQRRSPPAVHRRRSPPAVHRLSASPPIQRRSIQRRSPALILKSPSPPPSPLYASVWDGHWKYAEKFHDVCFDVMKIKNMESVVEKSIVKNTPTEERMQQVFGLHNKFGNIASSLGGTIFLIGSHQTDLALLTSDVNFMFLLKGDNACDLISSALRNIENIKVYAIETSKISGYVIDGDRLSFTISVNEKRAQFPSKFLSAVIQSHPICQKFLMSVKLFAKDHNLSSRGALYLGVLVLQKSKIVPELLANKGLHSLADIHEDLNDCIVASKIAAQRFNDIKEDLGTIPVSVLLHRFFLYFGFVHDFRTLAVSVRGSRIVRKEAVGCERFHLAIVDPFQPSQNVCEDVSLDELLRMVNVFRDAAGAMSEKKDITS